MATLADYDNILKEFSLLKDFYIGTDKDFDAFITKHADSFTPARLLCLKKKYKTAQEQDDPTAWVEKELKKYTKKHAAKVKEGEVAALKDQVAQQQAQVAQQQAQVAQLQHKLAAAGLV